MGLLRRNDEAAIAPVLRMVILLAFAVCFLHMGTVSSLNKAQYPLSGCGVSSRSATDGQKSTFGTVEQTFFEQGVCRPRSERRTDLQNRRHQKGKPAALCCRGVIEMNQNETCIRTHCFWRSSMGLLWRNDEAAIAPVLRMVILLQFAVCFLHMGTVSSLNKAQF